MYIKNMQKLENNTQEKKREAYQKKETTYEMLINYKKVHTGELETVNKLKILVGAHSRSHKYPTQISWGSIIFMLEPQEGAGSCPHRSFFVWGLSLAAQAYTKCLLLVHDRSEVPEN